ncbi:hypothetical protein ASG89_25575 [Paenibacillus sp. Soil766]|nr:hypothetical protein ASG89_25575 [Paenibacillus sp. Soil766]
MMTLFIVCFFVGLALTLLITIFGVDSFELHGDAGGAHGAHGHGHGHSGPSWFNMSSLLAGLTVFGGVGYILNKVGMTNGLFILLFAVAAGLVMAWLFFLLYAKVIYKHDDSMKESDFELSGQLGKLTVPINGKGMGEMVYVLHGTTRTISVRSENGESLAKGTKVVILNMGKGVATVTEFSDFE